MIKMRPQMSEKVASVIFNAYQALDDKTASIAPELFETLEFQNDLIKAGTKINWNGMLKRATVDLWNIEENNPDNAPILWEDIMYKDGYRIIPEVITANSFFSLNEYGWWNNILYKSLIDNNVWTPDQYPLGWEAVNE